MRNLPNASRVAHPDHDRVNVLLCRTLRGPLQRQLKPLEIILDSADGLNWETLCRLDALHFVPKKDLHNQRGIVCKERRRAISLIMLQIFPFET